MWPLSVCCSCFSFSSSGKVIHTVYRALSYLSLLRSHANHVWRDDAHAIPAGNYTKAYTFFFLICFYVLAFVFLLSPVHLLKNLENHIVPSSY